MLSLLDAGGVGFLVSRGIFELSRMPIAGQRELWASKQLVEVLQGQSLVGRNQPVFSSVGEVCQKTLLHHGKERDVSLVV